MREGECVLGGGGEVVPLTLLPSHSASTSK